jgi:hypothetical protein
MNKPKYVIRHNSSGESFKVTRFKLHLKRKKSEGASTHNEAWCGYYPIGGNNGQLVTNIENVDCKKCRQLHRYHLKKWKKKLPFQK